MAFFEVLKSWSQGLGGAGYKEDGVSSFDLPIIRLLRTEQNDIRRLQVLSCVPPCSSSIRKRCISFVIPELSSINDLNGHVCAGTRLV
jgi:hypothetical protein